MGMQSSPGAQAPLSATCSHWLVASSQASVVQATPSEGHGMGVPAIQPVGVGPLPLQVSTPLQSRPSSQAALLGVKTQAARALLQESAVQLRPSLQTTGLPG
ncbi:MAG: hypothetical protein R3B70_34260 [Polyangiaceae bacterium]